MVNAGRCGSLATALVIGGVNNVKIWRVCDVPEAGLLDDTCASTDPRR